MKVAAIILNYNTADESRNCAECLRKQKGVDVEVVIVDNYSEHNNRERLIDYCRETNTIFVAVSKNKGINAGYNAGLRYAESVNSEYALIIDPHIIISDTDYVAKLVTTLKSHDDAVVVGSDIINQTGAHLSPLLEFGAWWHSLAWVKSLTATENSVVENFSSSKYCDVVPRYCFMIDMNFILSIDMFDEHTFCYCEDYILSRQVVAYEYKIYYTAETQAIYSLNEDGKSLDKTALANLKHASIHYINRYSGYNFLERFLVKVAIQSYLTAKHLFAKH